MSKYQKLWEYISNISDSQVILSFDQIQNICGVAIDHSFLTYKKELLDYGWSVKKIYMKDKRIEFVKA